jgi:hypothetical protein
VEKSDSKRAKTVVEITIPNGKGDSLDTMPEVMKNFANESDQDLKVI